MAAPELVWLRKADDDLQQIYERLEQQAEGRGDAFFNAVDKTLERVALFPEIGSPFDLPIRRVLVEKGRYGIFYCVEKRGLVILAIEDLRQDPERIRRNLGIDP